MIEDKDEVKGAEARTHGQTQTNTDGHGPGAEDEGRRTADGTGAGTEAAVTILELRADEVIEVARAARHIRSLRELRDHTVEVQDQQLHTRTAVRRLEELCCDPRLIVALMLFAADHPDWAWVNFWHAFCPEMTLRQMGRERHINASTVKYWLNHVELPADAYDFIPEDR